MNSGLSVGKLFPHLRSEPKRRGVFVDGAFGLVCDSGGEVGVDFEGNVDGGVWVTGQKADDFIGDLTQAHGGGQCGDLD